MILGILLTLLVNLMTVINMSLYIQMVSILYLILGRRLGMSGLEIHHTSSLT